MDVLPLFPVDHPLNTPPVMGEFDPSRCDVRYINKETVDRICRDFHYAGRAPTTVVGFGLYCDDILAGIISYAPPTTPNTARLCGDEFQTFVLELNRLFIFDWLPKNSESWFIGQTFKMLRKDYPEYPILVSYADEGQEHFGYIYQATNWFYTGVSEAMNVVGYRINGRDWHNRSLVAKIGTCSAETVLQRWPNAIPIPGTPKHRYVYFLRDKKKWLDLLRWQVYNKYPKEMNRRPNENT